MTLALYLIAVALLAIAAEGAILVCRIQGVRLQLLPYKPKDREEDRMIGRSKVGIKL